MEIVSRKEAMAQGLSNFYSGKPCRRGHLAQRRCDSYACAECEKENKIRRRRANLEAHAEYNRKWNEANRSRAQATSNKWKHNGNMEHCRAYERKWKKDNPDKNAAAAIAYTTGKAQRIPLWADREAIKLWYRAARILTVLLGEKFHVDHIVPLRGKNVSGLHSFENLQLLPARENIRKSNKFEDLPC